MAITARADGMAYHPVTHPLRVPDSQYRLEFPMIPLPRPGLRCLTSLMIALASAAHADAVVQTGASFGLHGGYGLSDTLDLRTRAVPTAVFKDLQGANQGVRRDDALDLDGAIAGFQARYLMPQGAWVWGGAVDYSYTDFQTTVYDDVACPNANLCATDDQFDSELSSVVLVSGIFGRPVGRHFLYVRGGLALGDYELAIRDDNLNTLGQPSSGPNTGSATDDTWLTGFSVGAGDNFSLDRHFSIGVRYDYARFGDSDLDASGSGFCDAGSTSPLCVGKTGSTVAGDYPMTLETPALHLFKVELNYRF